MTITREPMGGGCPENSSLMRFCEVCRQPVNRLCDDHVIIAASWRRCNNIFCRECYSEMMRYAKAGLESVVLFIE
jgi:hypothetical protein